MLPLRRLLTALRDAFPAESGPFLRFLAALAAGREAATAATVFLDNVPGLALLHAQVRSADSGIGSV